MALRETDSTPNRPLWQRALPIAIVLAAAVSVPYLFPAPLSISRSYVAGFSNRVAVLIMLFGIGFVAFFTRGNLARTMPIDSKLTWRVLPIALLITWLDCLQYCIQLRKLPQLFHLRFQGILQTRPPGFDSGYLLNRFQLLAAHRVLYRQFEFVYGPLLLYPLLWTQHLLHDSALQAYVITWLIEWSIGVFMIWTVVRYLDIPVPSRVTLFAFFLLTQLVNARTGGLNYAPTRSYLAAFCIVVSYTVWKRFKNAWLIATCSILSVAIGLCVSADEAVAIALGFLTALALLALTSPKDLPWQPLLASTLGIFGCFVVANHIGLLDPLYSFGGGGYNYPLLPSAPIFLALFAYIVTGCALYRCIDRGHFASVVVPLVAAGISMLPAALGRCDVLHICAATPAFVVGVATIWRMPGILRWYRPIAFAGLFVLPFCLNLAVRSWTDAHNLDSSPASSRNESFWQPQDNQFYVSHTALPSNALPCDHLYFSPSYMPDPTQKFLPSCLDTGYYLAFTNVITPANINDKLEELRQHASQPLLMENSPLEKQLPLQLAKMVSLQLESASFWVPPARHPPLTYAPIIAYIRQHYIPGPIVADGKLQIWYPSSTKPPSTSP